jgi:hypothetical protein
VQISVALGLESASRLIFIRSILSDFVAGPVCNRLPQSGVCFQCGSPFQCRLQAPSELSSLRLCPRWNQPWKHFLPCNFCLLREFPFVTGSFIRCKGSSLLIVFGGTVWLLPARHLYVCCLCAPVVCESLLGDTGIVFELPDQKTRGL